MIVIVINISIQLVRVVANISVHPEVGPAVAEDRDTVDHLLLLLGVYCIFTYNVACPCTCGFTLCKNWLHIHVFCALNTHSSHVTGRL